MQTICMSSDTYIIFKDFNSSRRELHSIFGGGAPELRLEVLWSPQDRYLVFPAS